MPEIPDLTVYVETLARRVVGRRLEGVRVASPFVLRTAQPPVASAAGRTVRDVRRVGKRIVVLRRKPGAPLTGRSALAAFDLAEGTLVLTEAGSRHRASLHVLAGGDAALARLDPGGVEPLETDAATFAAALRRERRTLKRALTDPRIVAGVGNAYSDEILHAARPSPMHLTTNLDDARMSRAPSARRRCRRSSTRRTRRTTARAARPRGGCSRTARSPVSSGRTGRGPSTSG